MDDRSKRPGRRRCRPLAEACEARQLLTTWFDFGSATTAVAPGAVQVTPETSYSDLQGYGWTAGAVRSGVRASAASDPLMGDINASRDATFAVKLPNGTYDVTVRAAGDAWYHDRMEFTIEGQAQPIAFVWSFQTKDIKARAQVADGQLTVRMRDLGGFTPDAAMAALRVDLVELAPPPPTTRDVIVGTRDEFQAALWGAQPGDRILVRPGTYQGNFTLYDKSGTADRPIIIAALDPAQRPVIEGGTTGLFFSKVNFLQVRDLIIQNQSAHGMNIDDAGDLTVPSRSITLSNLLIRNGVGTGVKMAGVDDFRISGLVIDSMQRSGIDLVGCHNGTIEQSNIRGVDGVTFAGIQIKGGSRDVLVRDNRVEGGGYRAIHVGGQTDLYFFRPSFQGYEAKDITVEGNVIIGWDSAVAFSSIDGAKVRFNTIVEPRKWIFRILQEQEAEGSIPCRNGIVTDNLIVFRTNQLRYAVNIGDGTAPETFQFARNWWYAIDNPAASQPSLPTVEINGTYGIDPQFVDPANGNYRPRPGSPASNVGAYAPRS